MRWTWWDWSLSLGLLLPSVLWHCRLGHFTRKNPSPVWPYNVFSGTLNPTVSRHSSSGRELNFAALNRGHQLYSAGRPSRWALAHILVVIMSLSSTILKMFSVISKMQRGLVICTHPSLHPYLKWRTSPIIKMYWFARIQKLVTLPILG